MKTLFFLIVPFLFCFTILCNFWWFLILFYNFLNKFYIYEFSFSSKNLSLLSIPSKIIKVLTKFQKWQLCITIFFYRISVIFFLDHLTPSSKPFLPFHFSLIFIGFIFSETFVPYMDFIPPSEFLTSLHKSITSAYENCILTQITLEV